LALIMNKVWLAVLLGAIVGLGAGMVPVAQLTAPPGTQPQLQMLRQNSNQPPPRPANSTDLDAIVLALLVGMVVAAPLYVMARRRGK
jgi:hypothetical protein